MNKCDTSFFYCRTINIFRERSRNIQGGVIYILIYNCLICTRATRWWLCIKHVFCEIQWPWPPLFSLSRLIQWSMGEGVLYNFFYTEWRHRVLQYEVWERGCYIILFSPTDVTAFHRFRHLEICPLTYYYDFNTIHQLPQCWVKVGPTSETAGQH